MSRSKRTSIISLILLIAIILSSINAACIRIVRYTDDEQDNPSPKMLQWRAQPTIKEQLVADTAGQDVLLGNLDKDQVEIAIPGNAFEQPARVTLVSSKKSPPVPSTEFTPIGAPITIHAGEETVYLQEPATITFKLDRSAIKSNPDPEIYWGAYYTGTEWQYIRPDEVNLENGTIGIKVTHFSEEEYAYGIIKDALRIQDYANRKAVEKFAYDKIEKEVRQTLGEMSKVMLGGAGVTDADQKKFVASLITDAKYSKLVKSVMEGDEKAFQKQLGTLFQTGVGKMLTSKDLDQVWFSKVKLTNPFAATLHYAKDIDTFFGAVADIYNGKPEDAATKIAELVVSKSGVLSIFDIAKKSGIELANILNNKIAENALNYYASQTFVKEKGDRDEWFQEQARSNGTYINKAMKNLALQYEQRGVKDPDLAAEKYLKEYFDSRIEKALEIAQKTEDLEKLIKIFGTEGKGEPIIENFLNPRREEEGWLGWLGAKYKANAPEDRLNELLEMIETIKKDTGTTTIGETKGPGVLSKTDLVYLATQLMDARNAGKAVDAVDYRNDLYNEALKNYTSFWIKGPGELPEGEGKTGISYSFTAEGAVGDWTEYQWYLNGIVVKSSSSYNELKQTFKEPNIYTLKCVARWPAIPGQITEYKTVEAVLSFVVQGALAIFPIEQSGEAGKPLQPFIVSLSGLPDRPASANLVWYVDGEPIAGHDKSIILSFPKPKTYRITVNLEQAGRVLAEGGPSWAIIMPATPEPVKTGKVIISSVPAGADIYIGGKPTGYQTPKDFDFVKGKYAVLLKKAGYKDHLAFAEVEPGRPTNYPVKLTPIESKPPPPTPTPTPKPPTPTPPKPPPPPSLDGTYSASWTTDNKKFSIRVTIQGNSGSFIINDGNRGTFAGNLILDPDIVQSKTLRGFKSPTLKGPCTVAGIAVKECIYGIDTCTVNGTTGSLWYTVLGGGTTYRQHPNLTKEK